MFAFKEPHVFSFFFLGKEGRGRPEKEGRVGRRKEAGKGRREGKEEREERRERDRLFFNALFLKQFFCP